MTCPASGNMVEADGFEPPRFLRARFTVWCNQPLCHVSIFGGPTGNRTPTRGLQSHCAPVITISPNFLATRERFERPSCSFGDCRSANWNYRAIIFNTLFRMCVLKHSKLLRLPVRQECFNTLGFFYVQEHKPSPRPPICSLE